MSRGTSVDTATYRLYGISEVLTISAPPFETWAAANGLSGDDALRTANTDSDDFTQLQEWAFGTDPNVSDSGALTITDGSSFSPGAPRVDTVYSGGNPIKLRYVRLKNHVAAGLDYSPEFSDSLGAFATDPNDPLPVQVSDDGGDYEVVEVPFPLFDSTGKKALSLFGRVVITEP